MLQMIRRRWKYLMASMSGKAEERLDPRVQVEQAIGEAKRQHQLLLNQAAAVLGNEREVEIRLSRELDEVEKLKQRAGQALQLADEARGKGDSARSAEFEEAAMKFASRLTAAEDTSTNLRELLQKAAAASVAARTAVEQNALRLKQTLAERSKLMTQLEAAKMQERINDAISVVNDMTGAGDVPTLAEVRDKIETRYARAMGKADLASGTVDAAMVEVERTVIDRKSADRLDQLRQDMGIGGGPGRVLEAAEPMPEFTAQPEMAPVEKEQA